MSYIGRDLRTGAFRQLDDISSSFNSSTTGFTMQVNSTNVSLGDVNQILLSLGGVIQKPGTDFTISGSTLTFTTAPAANTSFFAILLGSDNGGTVTPTDESVTDDKLANTISTINNTGGNLTVDVSGEINLDADDGKVRLKDGGTEIARFVLDNGSGDLEIVSSVSDKDIKLKGFDDSSNVTALTLDMSDAGAATLNNGLTLTDGNITFAGSGHGIHLGVTTATAANLLDDYEEGEWTIGLEDASGNAMTLNATYRKGFYTKIGHRVIISGYADVSSAGSASGNMRMTGLPFAVINNVAGYSALTAYPENMSLGTAGYSVVGYTGVNASRIILGLTDSTAGQTHLQASEIGTGNLIFSAVYVTNE